MFGRLWFHMHPHRLRDFQKRNFQLLFMFHSALHEEIEAILPPSLHKRVLLLQHQISHRQDTLQLSAFYFLF